MSAAGRAANVVDLPGASLVPVARATRSPVRLLASVSMQRERARRAAGSVETARAAAELEAARALAFDAMVNAGSAVDAALRLLYDAQRRKYAADAAFAALHGGGAA